MLSVDCAECHKFAPYAENCSAECHYAECFYGEFRGAQTATNRAEIGLSFSSLEVAAYMVGIYGHLKQNCLA